MTNPYILLAIVGVWIASLTGCYLYSAHVQKAEDIATQAKIIKADQTHYEAVLAQQEKTAYDASESYQKELARLRSEPQPVPVVRLCNVAQPAPKMPSANARSRSDDPAASRSLVQPAAAAPDLGPELVTLMLEADECSAQLRSLQAFIEGLK